MKRSYRNLVVSAIAIVVLNGSFFVPGVMFAQAVDNSAQNKGAQPTADNQSNAKADRMLTAQVRRAIVKDKSLSVAAHNIKIIVQSGKVTLKGPVASQEERQKVLDDAGSVTTADNIADQLTAKQ